jgi:1,5-anhydro-D-fructose reductase (1,5-anhydro-D-mannitol-forming)
VVSAAAGTGAPGAARPPEAVATGAARFARRPAPAAPAPGTWRWAIAGCGWLARDFVAPHLRDRLVAAVDPDAARAAELGPPASLADALRAADALYVAAPNHLHAELTIAAARAGVHVLCEKPMATSIEDARAMVGACRAAGVRYATACNQRHHPAHRRLRELVRAGVLGRVVQARVHYACTAPPWWDRATDWHFDEAQAGGGALVDLAPHGVDLVSWLCDAEPVEAARLTQRAVLDVPVDDGGALLVRLEGDVLLSSMVSYACPETFPRRRLELIGTRAMAVATDTMGQDPGGTLELVHAEDGRREPVAFDEQGDPFALQLEAFEAGDVPDPEHDLRVLEVLL